MDICFFAEGGGAKSKYTGVCQSGKKTWKAAIYYKVKTIYLYSLNSEAAAAAAAYDVMALIIHGPGCVRIRAYMYRYTMYCFSECMPHHVLYDFTLI